MLNNQELLDLEENLTQELKDKLTSILIRLNRSNKLEEFLELIGLSNLLKNENVFTPFKNGKILVVGQSKVKKEDLLSVAKDLGFQKDRFEFMLGYYDAKKYNFKNLQWNPNYCLVLVGPMPHSTTAKGEYSSVIAMMESAEGYPPIIRLGLNELHITKSNFKSNLCNAIYNSLIYL